MTIDQGGQDKLYIYGEPVGAMLPNLPSRTEEGRNRRRASAEKP